MHISPWPYREANLLTPLMRIVRHFFVGIRNLIYWFPVIWNDRNYDNFYISKILRHKLADKEKHFRKYGMSVGAARHAKQMRVCMALLDRHMAGEYDTMVLAEHDRKWGELEIGWNPLDNGNYEMTSSRPGVASDKDAALEEREYRWRASRIRRLQQQDIDLLFRIMAKHYDEWWD